MATNNASIWTVLEIIKGKKFKQLIHSSINYKQHRSANSDNK